MTLFSHPALKSLITESFYSKSDQLGNAYDQYELYSDIPDPMMAFAATVVSTSVCPTSEISDEY